MKKYLAKLISQLRHSMIYQVMSYFWVFIVNPFSFLWSFFFSRKLCFLWSPCLLHFAESVSLDTSGKPTVVFLLKITSPSWIILSILPDKLNWLIVEELIITFLEIIFILLLQKNFDMAKILEAFWRIYLNIIFWILLWMLTSLVIWSLNITVSTSLKHCYK